MEKKTIQIQVRADLAEKFESFPEDKKRKIEALLSLRLDDLTQAKPSLEEVMDRMSDYAQSRGLTPEILESILNEE
jgi:pantoate kinase